MASEPVRLVSYLHAGRIAVGLLDGSKIWNLRDAYAAYQAGGRRAAGPAYLPDAMRSFIALGSAGIDAALSAVGRLREAGQDSWRGRPLSVAASDATLLPPVPDPDKILCMGLIFPSHAVATGQQMAKQPQIFMKPRTGLVGHDAPIVIPKAWPDRVASGTELCAVIGRVARDVREEDALDCVYGYTILNDITARGMSFPKNKMFETFAPVGPCLVPKEFYPDPQSVSLRIRVNGKEGEAAHTRDMVFPVRRSIRDCAEAMTLLPGDYVATGDVGSEIWLRPGDVAEAEVDAIGTLRNPCVAEAG